MDSAGYWGNRGEHWAAVPIIKSPQLYAIGTITAMQQQHKIRSATTTMIVVRLLPWPPAGGAPI
jgi:hypothetical protein